MQHQHRGEGYQFRVSGLGLVGYGQWVMVSGLGLVGNGLGYRQWVMVSGLGLVGKDWWVMVSGLWLVGTDQWVMVSRLGLVVGWGWQRVRVSRSGLVCYGQVVGVSRGLWLVGQRGQGEDFSGMRRQIIHSSRMYFFTDRSSYCKTL